MAKPRVLVFSGYGLNCEEETKFAFEKAGAKADIVHINDLIDKLKKLSDYQILAFPGGFSYGDDTGSGNAYANKIKNHLWSDLHKQLKKDCLVIGMCNGFQILSNLGLLPALYNSYGQRQVALMHNDSARYTVRWVDLQVENNTPWLKELDKFCVPVAHGEGKLYTPPKTLFNLKSKKLIALRYISDEICAYQDLEANPNGSIEDIAGITDETGKILGLMPHPERAIFFTHLPHWPLLKEKYLREGKKLPTHGPGLKIFQNAIEYFR